MRYQRRRITSPRRRRIHSSSSDTSPTPQPFNVKRKFSDAEEPGNLHSKKMKCVDGDNDFSVHMTQPLTIPDSPNSRNSSSVQEFELSENDSNHPQFSDSNRFSRNSELERGKNDPSRISGFEISENDLNSSHSSYFDYSSRNSEFEHSDDLSLTSLDSDHGSFVLPKRLTRQRCVLRSVCEKSDRILPLDSENLCLFTCVALALFRRKNNFFKVKNIARALCVLYHYEFPFILQNFERVLRIKPGRSQHVMFILCNYVYGYVPGKNHIKRREMSQKTSILKTYKGHPLDDLVTVENYFKLRISLYTKGSHNVLYNYDEDEVDHSIPFTSTNTFVRKFLPSSRKQGIKVNLHVSDDLSHVDLITDLDRFGDQFVCTSCDQNFSSLHRMRMHEKNCDSFQKYYYIGGVYNPKKTVFERLEDYAIHVPEHLKFLRYFIVFDFESLLKLLKNVNQNEDGVYEKHVPVSVAIGSNITEEASKGYFICDKDPLKLIRKFIEKLLELSDMIYDTMRPQFQALFDELDKKMVSCRDGNNKKEWGLLSKLKTDLENLARRAIVLTFNGSRYDIPLIFSWFFHIYREMGNFKCDKIGIYDTLRTDSFRTVIMRGTQVLNLVTDKLVFRDLSLFLAPGTSYKKYLLNFSDENDVEKLEKLHFPFKLMTSYESLQSTKLPSFQDFYSHLKDCNSFESEEQYENEFKKIWADPSDETKIKGGENLLSILKTYNLNDCWPLIQAVIKHMKVYRTEMNVDLFYENISLPGVGMKWMFTGEPNKFYTFPKEFGWINRQIQGARTGGLCTVLKRRVEVGTPMRKYEEHPPQPPKMCKGGEVVDVTSLYPSTFLNYEFFINLPIFRQPPEFKPVRVGGEHGVSASSHSWLRHMQRKDNVKILTGHDNGEVKCGSKCYPVDGFSRPTKNDPLGRVYSYEGCFIHGHICWQNNPYKQVSGLPPSSRADKLNELLLIAALARAKLKKVHNDLIEEGYTLITIKSCEWAKQKNDLNVRRLFYERPSPSIDHDLYPKSCLSPTHSTMEDIVMKVKSGDFKGIIKCDIFLEDKDAEKYEFFPFFCQNQMVTREQLSPKMREICEKYELLKTSRRQLISTSNVKGFITVSQLLKWYLEHDAKITHIYWVLEYTSAPVFRDKIEQMADFRRKADKDKRFKAEADASKLGANSFIGKCAENVLTHTKTKICTTAQVHQHLCKNTFINATPIPCVEEAEKANVSLNNREAYRDLHKEIDDFCNDSGILLGDFDKDAQMYVVDTKKSAFVFKSPIIIQFIVYNLAKLHMLRFAHDVLRTFCRKGSIEICYTDTDSFFWEGSEKKLDLLIRDSKKNEFFEKVRHEWFPKEFCETHKPDYLRCKTTYKEWEPKCKACRDTFDYDSKKPGLFKLESRFTKGVFLSPKLYCVENEKTGEVKGGSKGIQRGDRNSGVTDFKALETQLCMPKEGEVCVDDGDDTGNDDNTIPDRLQGKNTGFKRTKSGIIHTYNQTRNFSGIYTKRRLMEDQINTLPLLTKKDKEKKFDTVERAFIDDDNVNDPEIFHRFYQNIIGQR